MIRQIGSPQAERSLGVCNISSLSTSASAVHGLPGVRRARLPESDFLCSPLAMPCRKNDKSRVFRAAPSPVEGLLPADVVPAVVAIVYQKSSGVEAVQS